MQQPQGPIIGAIDRGQVVLALDQSGAQYAVEELREPNRRFLLPQDRKQHPLAVEQKAERQGCIAA